MSTPSRACTITLENVELLIAARKANPRVRWAAMATHYTHTNRCKNPRWRPQPGVDNELRPVPSLLSPMLRGNLQNVIRRTRLLDGLNGVRQTWGAGLRALLKEPEHIVPAQGRGQP